jgi:hypothetical protein
MPEIKKLVVGSTTINRVYMPSGEIYRVVQADTTVFHRQLSFGSNASIDQSSRTSTSITWRIYNSDPGLSVSAHTSINSTSYANSHGTISAGGSILVTYPGLSPGTSYTIYQRNSRGDIDIQPVFNQNTWSTEAGGQTSTPSIQSMSCTSFGGEGSVNVPVRNNDTSSATVEVSYTSNFAPGTVQSTEIAAGPTPFSFSFSGYSVPPGTVTFYARALASGKTMSTVTSRTQTINACFGEF